MAILTKTIAVGNPGGAYDYSSIAAWESAHGGSATANLVSDGNSIVGQCFTAGGEFLVAGNVVTISGFTTDASHTITLTTGTGQSFRDNASAQTNALAYNAANGAAIRSTSSGYQVHTLEFSNDVSLSKLQIRCDGTSLNGAIRNNNTLTLDFCIVEALILPPVISQGGIHTNSLFVQRGASKASVVQGNYGTQWYNCTMVTPSDVAASTVGIYCSNGGVVIENCAVFGSTSVTGGFTPHTLTTNMTDVVGPPAGWTGSKTYGSQFRNTTTGAGDWALKLGADCIDAGTTDATNALHDIVGTLRPQGSAYDIGAWEYVAGAPPPTVLHGSTLMMMGVG